MTGGALLCVTRCNDTRGSPSLHIAPVEDLTLNISICKYFDECKHMQILWGVGHERVAGRSGGEGRVAVPLCLGGRRGDLRRAADLGRRALDAGRPAGSP